jgi:thiosulfate dehydrogenase
MGALLTPWLLTAGADERSQVWDIARGGQLYDKWYAVLARTPPEETHPAYPAEGKKKGSSTWRCKECHGWDYRGAKGAYGTGSHYTGIGGLRDLVGTDSEGVMKTLRDDNHRYTEEMIPDSELRQLALFVSLGQTDMDLYVQRASKESRGDPQRGAALFQTICTVCHGFDGKAINFKDENKPEFVGTVAIENPWEFIHKARFGQPGIPMIALIALPMEDIADLLAFAQTLPTQ